MIELSSSYNISKLPIAKTLQRKTLQNEKPICKTLRNVTVFHKLSWFSKVLQEFASGAREMWQWRGWRGRWRLLGVPGWGQAQAGTGPGGDRPGRRPGVAKPGQISMSLLAMKSIHEPVVVGLAGMVQEQPATRLAGMDQAEIYINMQRICCYMKKLCLKYANIDCISQICKRYARNMPEICLNMHIICRYMP